MSQDDQKVTERISKLTKRSQALTSHLNINKYYGYQH